MQSAVLEPIWLGRLAAGCELRLSEIDQRGNRPPWSQSSFAGEFTNSHALVYGCRFRGQIIGFGVVHHVVPEAHLLNFAIAQEFRGLGVGRRLLHFMLAELAQDRCATLSLEVRRSNNAAQALYSSLGFELVGERIRYYPDDAEDALVMKLHLDTLHEVAVQGSEVRNKENGISKAEDLHSSTLRSSVSKMPLQSQRY